MDERRVEFGIRIDVTDPEGIPEVEYAFRPAFVRYLFETEDIIMSQVCPLPYETAIEVENEEQMKALRNLLDNSEGTLPLIIVTQAVRLPKEEPAPAFGKIPFPAAASPLSASPPFPAGPLSSSPFPAASPLAAPPAGLFSKPFPTAQEPKLEYYWPVSADKIAASHFAYAITFQVTEEMHSQLAKRLKKEYMPGDVLFVEPKRFGGNIRIYGKDEKELEQQVYQRAHRYSKDRKYPFGDVQFEFDARNTENRELINRIRASGEMEAGEKLAILNQKIDELQEENEKRVRKISEMRDQAQAEFEKGYEAGIRNNEELILDYDQKEKELQAAKARILHLEQENRTARSYQKAAETIRALPEMPSSNQDVVNWFTNVFGDRIVFTERAVKTACKCDVKASGLWYYLYHMATSLYDIHHAGAPEVEKEFYRSTGIEMAPGEKAQTNKNDKVMKQRYDTYEGKEIFAAPHVKLDDGRSGGNNRRIYYCYDREIDRVIVSWVGDHLDTSGGAR